ncbi:hypothetical protein PFLUV_G00185860 [Perca fluviatilis]|uniref:Uncharacterized protein n=1 Tax=Perca fluviatilis TaxID=8168 RepID=A0A6A5EQD6_PERFL|nr:uncharacterized protein LOC120543939 [Perca fluviatilis]XP_039633301.1 uncharacterized protein LOC120543939 [Perca fluviatilis]XP_039633302.1 uncharacterized protein LOC120543939 [Perca fluviatilis]KAF1378074.1 hypothetical protein PFLUV_G00185860 [Perca fluviatilis]
MDEMDDYIWQRRIQHGVRYQKSSVPFPDSVEIGLDFNAALERTEKLDLSLLTNGVMLELCEFAKTVTKSETYFLFEMLDFNFDLGVDVDIDQQYYDYSRRAHNKIKLLKEQIKVKPQRWKETFPLPDLSAILGATDRRSRKYYPKRNKMVDFSVLSIGSNNSQSAEHQKTESNGDMYVVKRGGLKPTENTFTYCKDLGVTPVVRPGDAAREKLDPSLVNNGVMLELLNFSRVLCGTHTGIVYDLVKQNFGHELDKTLFRMQLSKLMERKYACLTPEDKDAFRKEPFEVQTQTQKREYKRKRKIDPAADYEEQEGLTMTSKRRGTPKLMDDYVKDFCQDGDLSYMCPVDFETEMQSGSDAKPETMTFESSFSETEFSLDVKEEEEEVVVSPVPPRTNCLTGTHAKNTTLKAVSALFSEDDNVDRVAKTPKQKLWTRRTTRAKRILKSSKVNDLFARCREIALDFNVGSGNKQNVDPFLLTNHVLFEIYRFATTMSKSFRSFLFEILDINFNLVPQGNLYHRNFIYYMITKEKILQNHPDRWKPEFLSSPFQFPEVYNMVDVTSDFKTGPGVETEQPASVDLPASTESQEADMELHPYCKKFGLNLWSLAERPANQKLDLTALTTGAVLEIFGFVRELCAPVREMVNDVLEHNFDLDLQSEASVASGVIKRWYSLQKSVMKGQSPSPKITRWLNTVVPINGYSQLNRKPKTANANGSRDLDSGEDEDVKLEMEDFLVDVKTEETMEEDETINSYDFCEEIGLILDVGSKPEAGTKLDLRLLTRGVLYEMHRYVERNCNRYVPALYEILEYNFDLRSQNHRRVEFAWAVASQVIAIAGKNGRKGDYLKRAVELPIEVLESQQAVCKEEPDDCFGETDYSDNDIVFVRELKPVDIEVEIE